MTGGALLLLCVPAKTTLTPAVGMPPPPRRESTESHAKASLLRQLSISLCRYCVLACELLCKHEHINHVHPGHTQGMPIFICIPRGPFRGNYVFVFVVVFACSPLSLGVLPSSARRVFYSAFLSFLAGCRQDRAPASCPVPLS